MQRKRTRTQGKAPGPEDNLFRRGKTPRAEPPHTKKGKTRKATTNGTTLKGTPKDKGTKQRRRTPEDAGINIPNYEGKRGHKRRRSMSPTEVPGEAGGVKKRRISSTAAQAYRLGAASRRPGRCVGSRLSPFAARVHDPGAASRRKRSCKAGSASSSSGRYTRAFGAAARTGRLSLKKRGRGAPAASE